MGTAPIDARGEKAVREERGREGVAQARLLPQYTVLLSLLALGLDVALLAS